MKNVSTDLGYLGYDKTSHDRFLLEHEPVPS